LLATQLSHEKVTEALGQQADQPETPVTAGIMHAAINRLTGGTQQESGGTLFSDHCQFYSKSKTQFDVYAWSKADQAKTASLFECGLIGGYGRNASSGAGHLRLSEINPCEFTIPTRADACMSLASVTPALKDGKLLSGQLETRSGRLGGDFAIGPTPDGKVQRQKKPITTFTTGSVFHYRSSAQWIGRVLRNIHPYAPIRHYAMAPVLPCHLMTHTTGGSKT